MGEEDIDQEVLAADMVLDADTSDDHSSDWNHGNDHGGFYSDGDGTADNGGNTFQVLAGDMVLDADTSDDHSSDWNHGNDHGGFYSDGDGTANDNGGNKELVSVHGAITPK